LRQIRGALEDVNGMNAAIVTPYFSHSCIVGEHRLKPELDHVMTVLNGIRLPRIFFGFVLGASVVAVGGNVVAQEQPVDTPQAAAASEDSTDGQGLGQIYATIDGEAITEADLAILAQDYTEVLNRLPPEMRIPELLNGVIRIRLLAQAAEMAGMDKDELTMRRIEFQRLDVLSNEFVRQSIESAVTDKSIRARFDEELANFEPDDELHLRHILVDTEEEIRAVIAEIEEGGDFATIAKEKSKDRGSAVVGGDLDFVPRGGTVPAFNTAAFALEVGEYTKEPVQTQFGWHVILLEEKRKSQPPEFAAEEARIRSDMVGEVMSEKFETLRANAHIEIIAPEPEPEAEPEPSP